MKRLAVLAAAGLLGLVGYVVWVAPPTAPQVPRAGADLEPREGATSAVPGPVEAEPVAVAEDPAETSARRAVERGVVGAVRDGAGAPLAGALLTWTPLAPLPADPEQRWAELERISAVATCGADGRFVLEEPAELGGRASVVWATHPGGAATSIELGAERATWPRELELVLPARAPVEVVVSGANGALPAAVVRQVGTARDPAAPAARLFREVRLDAGRSSARIAPCAEVCDVAVRSGRLSSATWSGTPAGVIHLRLPDSFTVEGVVVRGEGLDGRDLALAVVAERAGRRQVLAEETGSLATWGPLEVPLVPAEAFAVRLEGEMVVPVERPVRVPAPGATVRMELEARVGVAVWFVVTDESDVPLPEATTTLTWVADGRRVSRASRPRSDGYTLFAGVPEGVVEVFFRAPGFASFAVPELLVPEETGEALQVALQRAVPIRGRCVAAGEPVRDFELAVWPVGLDALAEIHSFAGRADGSFELDGMAGVTAVIVGHAEGIGFSAPTPALVEAAAEPVLIELEPAREVRGVVLDARSGAPVAGAEVRVTAHSGQRPLLPLGALARSDEAGSFRLAQVPASDAVLTVAAPGFSTAEVAVPHGEAGGSADVGRVLLAARRPLTVRLVSGPAAPPGIAAVSGLGPERLPRRLFENGVARWEAVGAGVYVLEVAWDDSVHRIGLGLGSGTVEWDFELDLSSDAVVRIRVEAPDGETLRDGMEVSLTSNAPGAALATRQVTLDPEGRATVAAFPLGAAEITVVDALAAGARPVAHELYEVVPGEQSVVVRLGGEPRRVRVVDAEGEPLPGARVVATRESGAWIGQEVVTGPDGSCELWGVDGQLVRLHVAHATAGTKLGIPFQPADPRDELLVTLDARGSLSVQTTGLRGAVPGLELQLTDPARTYYLPSRVGDDSGLAVWTNLGEGDYVVGLNRPDFWRHSQVVRAAVDAPPALFPTRRRIALEVRVMRGGAPAPGVRVALAYVDAGGADVELLLEDDLAHASPSDLRTDASGRLLLEGVPEGEYRWSAPGAGAGTFTAELGGANVLSIALD